MNGFDLLAPVYDKMNNLVFGKSMVDAQTFFLDRICAGDHVLILGGGTGWLLEELVRRQPDCEVWYVESSSRMLDSARQRCGDLSHVHFILGTQLSIPARMFDVVIMNFFLDLFSASTVARLVEQIKMVTQPQGRWIVTDFENSGKLWQSMVLKIMTVFFRLVCGIEAEKLPDLKATFTEQRMSEITSTGFFYGFIRAGLYQKSSSQAALPCARNC